MQKYLESPLATQLFGERFSARGRRLVDKDPEGALTFTKKKQPALKPHRLKPKII
jgi:hypothetical protein